MKFRQLLTTSTCFVGELLKADADYYTETFDIWLNGGLYASSDRAVFSVYGLQPDTIYELKVTRGAESSAVFLIHTEAETLVMNVRSFGASGDGGTDDTAFLQAAILACPAGGRIYIPAGTYRFTHLFLKSNLTLELEEGALLQAIPDRDRLPVLPGRAESAKDACEYIAGTWEGKPADSYVSILTGMFIENVVICGRGTIDGSADFDNWWDMGRCKGYPARPKMLHLNHCRNITLQGLTIKNSPSWNLHPFYSDDIRFLDLNIISPDNSHNTDGIDPDSCKNVEIAGVHFSVGDDCIAIKSGQLPADGNTQNLRPSENIEIHNCLMESGHGGVTIGSESAGGVHHVLVRNCFFLNTDRGLRVKSRRGRGRDSYVSGISFQHVRMDGVKTPFVINCFYYCGDEGKTDYVRTKDALPVDERTPRVGDIIIRHVTCTNCHVAGLFFYGLPESKIELVDMNDVHISYAQDAEAGKPAMMADLEPCRRKGIFVRNALRVVLKNVSIMGAEGELLDLNGVDEWRWMAEA